MANGPRSQTAAASAVATEPDVDVRRGPDLALAGVAAVVGVVVVLAVPNSPDLAAHLFGRDFLSDHGYSLWNNYWYAGQYSFVRYSLTYYPLAALVGPAVLGIASVSAAAFAVARLCGRVWGDDARWAAASFAVLWPGLLLAGVLPFALGAAFALLALVALEARRPVVFAVLAALAAATSPLSFVYLAMVVAAVILADRRQWRRYWWAAGAVAVVLGAELVLARLFPSGGRYPFRSSEALTVLVLTGLAAAATWGEPRLRVVRVFLALYAAATVMVFLVPSEVGANIARLRLAALPVALLIAGVRRWRPAAVCIPLVLVGALWNLSALGVSYGRADDPGSERAYWAPTIRWLEEHRSPNHRVEVVDTSSHWPAYHFPDSGIPIARGWFRQSDFPANELLYRSSLEADEYLDWLHDLGVAFVVLGDAPPDYSAQTEADLIRSGDSGLRLVHEEGPVQVYAVPEPEPIVRGPGSPQVVEMGPSGLVLDIDRAGTYRVAVGWNPYWRASQGCLAPTDDGMTSLTSGPGRVRIATEVSAGNLVSVLGGSDGATCT